MLVRFKHLSRLTCSVVVWSCDCAEVCRDSFHMKLRGWLVGVWNSRGQAHHKQEQVGGGIKGPWEALYKRPKALQQCTRDVEGPDQRGGRAEGWGRPNNISELESDSSQTPPGCQPDHKFSRPTLCFSVSKLKLVIIQSLYIIV